MAYYENNVEKDHGNKKSIQVLADTAETISTCGKDIQKVAENIMISCHIPGTKGAAYRNQLLAKVDDLKKLAILYNSASQQLIGAAGKPNCIVWLAVFQRTRFGLMCLFKSYQPDPSDRVIRAGKIVLTGFSPIIYMS